MSAQMILNLMPSVISSPESVDGALPCALPDGRTTSPSGQEVARASLSARQAKEAGLLTSGTYGQHGSGSSRSENLQWFLASRLKERFGTGGSILFKETWKESVTASGLLVCLLHALERRTAATGYGSWPTPQVADDNNSRSANPQTYSQNRLMRKNACSNLAQTAQALVPSGQILTGSCAKMVSGGPLNPAHSRWLMGFPPEWDDCAPTATRLSLKRQRLSSKRS